MKSHVTAAMIGLVCGLAFLALVSSMTGCAARAPKPSPAKPIIFRHCKTFIEHDGSQGCDCLTPLVVKGKEQVVAWCDGRVR